MFSIIFSGFLDNCENSSAPLFMAMCLHGDSLACNTAHLTSPSPAASLSVGLWRKYHTQYII